jgi:hypothetical protein
MYHDTAFEAWAFHQIQLDAIVDGIANGQKSISVSDDFSQEDVEYIQKELLRKYGLDAEVSLS